MLSLEEPLPFLEGHMPFLPSVESFARILHTCRHEKNHAYAMCLHAYMCENGLDAHPSLRNHLVSTLVEVGSMCDAQQVFDRLVLHRTACSWNSLIIGYVNCGEPQHAIILYQKMQEASLHPSGCTFLALLKACAKLKDVETGCRVHAEIARKGLERHLFIGSTLVDMYAKCGSLPKAQEVFDKLWIRDVVSWNALITGYTKLGYAEEALNCFKQMQLEGISPTAVTFLCSLKACGSIGAIDKGQEIHAEISRKGLDRDIHVGSTLVDMYANCGLLTKAQEVFDKLSIRNVVSWNALIAGYVKQGLSHEALNCYDQMQLEGICPNAVTFVCSLKACGIIEATDKGRELHAEIARKGLESDLFVGSTLVDMYANCGSLVKAREVFDKLLVRNIVSWNALIAGYAKHGLGEEALNCFEQMQLEGLSPNTVTYACSLKACGAIEARDKGQEIHAEIARKGMERDLFVGSTLVDMYANCGLLPKAQEVFDKLPVRNIVSWTALIAGYAKHGLGQEALRCFEQMQLEGVSPNTVTYACSLKACGCIGATNMGHEIHAEIARKGFLQRDIVVGNALVDMYAKCGLLAKAHEVFGELPVRDVVSWNALIGGYAKHGCSEEALNCFEQMQHDGITPDAVTYACSLKACGSTGATYKGQEIHVEIARKGLLERDLIVGNALVDMYANCGFLAKAREVFENLPARDVVSWTALIAGYAKHECFEDALHHFKQMQLQGVFPNAVTFVCGLKACGSIGATDKGQEIHAEIARKGLFQRDLLIGNSLIDMYAKCGLLSKAQEVFDELPVRDAVSWNALIAGYSQLGVSEHVFHNLHGMIGDGQKPNMVTFVSVFNACSHAGLVDKGLTFFEAMSKDYGIMPTLEHHTCMVDLLGRAGQVDKAVAMIKKMPFHPNHVVWHILLGACRKSGNVELGRQAFEHAVRIDDKDAAAYLCMSKIYADADMQEDTKQVEAMRVNVELKCL